MAISRFDKFAPLDMSLTKFYPKEFVPNAEIMAKWQTGIQQAYDLLDEELPIPNYITDSEKDREIVKNQKEKVNQLREQAREKFLSGDVQAGIRGVKDMGKYIEMLNMPGNDFDAVSKRYESYEKWKEEIKEKYGENFPQAVEEFFSQVNYGDVYDKNGEVRNVGTPSTLPLYTDDDINESLLKIANSIEATDLVELGASKESLVDVPWGEFKSVKELINITSAMGISQDKVLNSLYGRLANNPSYKKSIDFLTGIDFKKRLTAGMALKKQQLMQEGMSDEEATAEVMELAQKEQQDFLITSNSPYELERNEDGSLKFDKDGNPIVKRDSNGKPTFNAENPIINYIMPYIAAKEHTKTSVSFKYLTEPAGDGSGSSQYDSYTRPSVLMPFTANAAENPLKDINSVIDLSFETDNVGIKNQVMLELKEKKALELPSFEEWKSKLTGEEKNQVENMDEKSQKDKYSEKLKIGDVTNKTSEFFEEVMNGEHDKNRALDGLKEWLNEKFGKAQEENPGLTKDEFLEGAASSYVKTVTGTEVMETGTTRSFKPIFEVEDEDLKAKRLAKRKQYFVDDLKAGYYDHQMPGASNIAPYFNTFLVVNELTTVDDKVKLFKTFYTNFTEMIKSSSTLVADPTPEDIKDLEKEYVDGGKLATAKAAYFVSGEPMGADGIVEVSSLINLVSVEGEVDKDRIQVVGKPKYGISPWGDGVFLKITLPNKKNSSTIFVSRATDLNEDVDFLVKGNFGYLNGNPVSQILDVPYEVGQQVTFTVNGVEKTYNDAFGDKGMYTIAVPRTSYTQNLLSLRNYLSIPEKDRAEDVNKAIKNLEAEISTFSLDSYNQNKKEINSKDWVILYIDGRKYGTGEPIGVNDILGTAEEITETFGDIIMNLQTQRVVNFPRNKK